MNEKTNPGIVYILIDIIRKIFSFASGYSTYQIKKQYKSGESEKVIFFNTFSESAEHLMGGEYNQLIQNGIRDKIIKAQNMVRNDPNLIRNKLIRKRFLKINPKRNSSKLCNTVTKFVAFKINDNCNIDFELAFINAVDSKSYRWNPALKIYAYVINQNTLIYSLSGGKFRGLKDEKCYYGVGRKKKSLEQMIQIIKESGVNVISVRNRANTHSYAIDARELTRCDSWHKKYNGKKWPIGEKGKAPKCIYFCER